MGTMFQAADWFVRIRHKGGHVKITIWDRYGDKLFSDVLGPEPHTKFWNAIAKITSQEVVQAIQEKLGT
ncbi:MAG: hypothetical protein GX195_07570 [Firmicutes bacterium]|jgi:hypothetical protein|nr:hypothetical protein [Bacillota bacterium]